MNNTLLNVIQSAFAFCKDLLLGNGGTTSFRITSPHAKELSNARLGHSLNSPQGSNKSFAREFSSIYLFRKTLSIGEVV